MRILAIGDEVANTLYNTKHADLLEPVDVLLGCGDLPYTYMEHVVTALKVRDAFFVHGNHDSDQWLNDGTCLTSPGGWQNVDRCTARTTDKALIVAGLQGSIRYRPRAAYQYSQTEMWLRAGKLTLQLLLNRVFYGRFVDVIIAHSPPQGIQDGPDRPHRGFSAFVTLIRRFRPRLFLHGHKHQYGRGTWRTRYEETEVVNIGPYRVIDIDGDKISFGKLLRR